MNNTLYLIVFVCLTSNVIKILGDSPCADWVPYKDEKCIKIIDQTLRNYEDAMNNCTLQQNGGTLLTIRSQVEQEFISKLLFSSDKVVDGVWIGLKYSEKKFKWADDSEVTYSNWAQGSPSNSPNKSCVQILPDSSPIGKWQDEPCNKKNLVVCEKIQSWSISRLQKTLLDTRKQTEKQTEMLSLQMKITETLTSQINNLKQNPVPMGFIYMQLPSQPEPKTLWSIVEWKDVTSEYAGLFFRAEGGSSAAFGTLQGESSKRLTNIKVFRGSENGGIPIDQMWQNGETMGIEPGKWSRAVYTGDVGASSTYSFLSFLTTNEEVRPRNHAIKIWKRTK